MSDSANKRNIRGEAFLLSVTYAPFILNSLLLYLKILKKLKQKCFVYVSMFYGHAKLFQQNPTFYIAYLKMTKFGTKIGLFTTYVFSFLHRAQRITVYYETLSDHVGYEDIHVHIFS
jgi:hypothetical protein